MAGNFDESEICGKIFFVFCMIINEVKINSLNKNNFVFFFQINIYCIDSRSFYIIMLCVFFSYIIKIYLKKYKFILFYYYYKNN